ncbi:16.9 kDa class I heat shock protein 3 [Ricinus communis]|uniref:Heat-shock protein, putative n=1 Tax=Ricinus communis TaxID=3988 RepID=B9SMA2_RICCO|nr:16.9 kDa class I heat shock protein 3 [Ricinus communis]EEF35284.1 heat-shock protein, putative [Ricinus communis]|eukprot:XP_002527121.1 16.9 kDa class I heat shock protein 3 [Ricinus communis]
MSVGPWFGWGSSTDLWEPFGGGWGWVDRGGRDRDETSALAHVNVDWRETDNAHIFRADLPGVRKEEVKVQVEEGNVLQISGEKVKEQEETNDKWHRVERRRGTFVRRFRLPENANTDGIKCTLENGVLNVTVPKKQSQQNQQNVRFIDIA